MGGEKGKRKGIGALIKSIYVSEVKDDDIIDDDELDEMDEIEDAPASESKESAPVAQETKAPEIKLNDDIVEAIKNAIDEANLEGYDYYEFMKAISEQDLPSEKKKYEVVFSVIKGMGITADHLLETADHYREVLTKHREQFVGKLDSEEAESVTKLKVEAESVENTITAKMEEIEALKADIEQLSGRKESVLAQAQKNEAELIQLRGEANLAYKLFDEQISDGKSKISQYLK